MSENKEQSNEQASKVIVISGVTSGIGAGMLRSFTKLGHRVIGFGRREGKLEDLKSELKLEAEQLCPVDITDARAVREWGAGVLEKYGTPDLVVHNAVSNAGNQVDTYKLEDKDVSTSLDTNLKGALLLAQIFVPGMVVAKRGVFVNMSSWAGRVGFAGGSLYTMCKHALEGMTKCMAEEFKEFNELQGANLCAVCVSPGFVLTPLTQQMQSAAKQSEIPNGDQWAEIACPWILQIGVQHNGKSIAPPKIENHTIHAFCKMFWIQNVQDYLHPQDKS